MFRKTIILVAAGAGGVFALNGTAMAQDMPRYDVTAHCGKVAAFGGSPSEVVRNGCMKMEQSAYDELKGQWSVFPAAMRKHCDKVATFGGAGSYTTLKGCIDMEKDASNKPSGFKY